MKTMDEPQKDSAKISAIVSEMTKYDNKKGYMIGWPEMEKMMESVVNEAASFGEEAVPFLLPLLQKEDTWSSIFAVWTLKIIKSEKAVPALMDFIRRSDASDRWDSCDEAAKALVATGKPAIGPLFDEVRKDFFLSFLSFFPRGGPHGDKG